jgi:hypothetical protein
MNIRLGRVLALGSLATLCVVGVRTADAQVAINTTGLNASQFAWDNTTLTSAVQTLQAQVHTLQGQVGTLQSQLATANTQIADLQSLTQTIESTASCGAWGEYQGLASYQNFLDNPGYYQNVTLKYCYKP